jgi:hypothetical protein
VDEEAIVDLEEEEAVEKAATSKITPTMPTTTPDQEAKTTSTINSKTEILITKTKIKLEQRVMENIPWETKSAWEPTKGQPGFKHII